MSTARPRALAGSTSQAAARLLLLLERFGVDPTTAELKIFPDAAKVIHATSRLAKLDFWLRNPDYLADELLNDVEDGSISPEIGLAHVDRMLAGSAPTLHLYPMRRHRFGAWELPDNAMALLKSHGLVAQRRAAEPDTENASRARRDYFLLENGCDVLADMRTAIDQLEWYDAQAEAMLLLNVGQTGSAARARQYEQPEYASTRIGATIGSILDRTRERFAEVAARCGYSSEGNTLMAEDLASGPAAGPATNGEAQQ